jgi:hypothetical protein
MICLGQDNRNIQVALDNVSAKLILAILRQTTTKQLIGASEDLQRDGFALLSGIDAEAARMDAVSLLARHLDRMVHPSILPPQPQPAASEPTTETESSPEPPKTWLN